MINAMLAAPPILWAVLWFIAMTLGWQSGKRLLKYWQERSKPHDRAIQEVMCKMDTISINSGNAVDLLIQIRDLMQDRRKEDPLLRQVHENIDELRVQLAKQHEDMKLAVGMVKDQILQRRTEASDLSEASSQSIVSHLEMVEKSCYATRDEIKSLARSHDRFVDSLFGKSGGGYTVVDESNEGIRVKAKQLQETYGLSWDDALVRATNLSAEQEGSGMMDRV